MKNQDFQPIHRFNIGDTQYRHVIDFKTDSIRLEFLTKKTTQKWVHLITYDAMGSVFDASEKRLGRFQCNSLSDSWTFVDEATGERFTSISSKSAELLLDFEVAISKRWISDNRPEPDSDAARLAAHRAHFNIGLPPHPDTIAQRTALSNCQEALATAIGHLQAILNQRCTATAMLQKESQARGWLVSIGSEPDDKSPQHNDLAILRKVVERVNDWTGQGGAVGYAGKGRWGFISKGVDFSPSELNALFGVVGIEPRVIPQKGTCATCEHAIGGQERGYRVPCLDCARPSMSNFKPAAGGAA